jgi:hypothetical protein
MPYAIKHLKAGGYKVKKDIAGPAKYFSKKPMPLKRAKAQMRALVMNERMR